MTFKPEPKPPAKDPSPSTNLITVYVQPELKADFKEYCERHNVSISRCIQQLIRYAIAEDE